MWHEEISSGGSISLIVVTAAPPLPLQFELEEEDGILVSGDGELIVYCKSN